MEGLTPDGDPEGTTPLEPDERAGLIPTFVTTRADLNLVEQAGIADAMVAMRRRRPSVNQVLDDVFVRALHRRMFGGVWRWAGRYRATERNIGVDPRQIAVAVRDLVGDAAYWVAPEAAWSTPDESVCRVHHRLVSIHPFPNGNGRHARLYCDLLMRALGGEPFTWGGRADLEHASPDRDAYLLALRAADRNPEDLAGLVTFARS